MLASSSCDRANAFLNEARDDEPDDSGKTDKKMMYIKEIVLAISEGKNKNKSHSSSPPPPLAKQHSSLALPIYHPSRTNTPSRITSSTNPFPQPNKQTTCPTTPNASKPSSVSASSSFHHASPEDPSTPSHLLLPTIQHPTTSLSENIQSLESVALRVWAEVKRSGLFPASGVLSAVWRSTSYHSELSEIL
ncbi:hypothetical protein AC578_5359 [Pseudocercospora eumusae]|nr:hypothetical protein AC578_5359 [Pseudocercospora eumusae]